ncbi:MAG TPA: non-canonical purine NTP pyrophosphatase [Candidatus Saccharimonadales bacterium]|jgi:XTP/dITP diphosphohydrolase
MKMIDLIFATTNEYKLKIANRALRDYEVTLTSLPELKTDILEIQSDSQEEVAVDKAGKYFNILKRPLVSMDSGLFIEGLNGFPGVYTKYILDTLGLDGIMHLMKYADTRKAYTQRTVAFIDGNSIKTFVSRCDGTLLPQKRDENQLGYDSVFLVDGTSKTLSEMSDNERGEALGESWRQLGTWLQKEYSGG